MVWYAVIPSARSAMQGRQPDKLVLKSKEESCLHQLLRQGQTPLKVARRAQILVSRAAGQRVNEVAAKVGQDTATVWRVCDRYRTQGLAAALYDAPRSGRPRVFSHR